MKRIDPYLLDQSRKNKQEMNQAEVRLWWDLRRSQFGVKFRRQHVAHGYILDFACLPLKLNIEMDGSQHQDSGPDGRRDELLRENGWTILRFWSWEIFEDSEMVIRTIQAEIAALKRKTPATTEPGEGGPFSPT